MTEQSDEVPQFVSLRRVDGGGQVVLNTSAIWAVNPRTVDGEFEGSEVTLESGVVLLVEESTITISARLKCFPKC